MITPTQNKVAEIRTLKIEEEGDPWRGKTKPKIRLQGNWLARAGFMQGQRVEVKCLALGLLELRSGSAVVPDENCLPTPLCSSHETEVAN